MAAIIVNLECITNMHVGNGDVNFNIIDNEVERDPVTGYPTINASGVKGALREYCEKRCEASVVKEIFGDAGQAGKLRFLCADIVAMPVRASKGDAAYYLVSSETAIQQYNEKFRMFLDKDVICELSKENGLAAEGITLSQSVNVFGKTVYILKNAEFALLSLPVMARNKLENGKSKNLWYEELVPHHSLFTFAVLAEDCDKELLNQFCVLIDGKLLQFGGDATIGYGICKASVQGV